MQLLHSLRFAKPHLVAFASAWLFYPIFAVLLFGVFSLISLVANGATVGSPTILFVVVSAIGVGFLLTSLVVAPAIGFGKLAKRRRGGSTIEWTAAAYLLLSAVAGFVIAGSLDGFQTQIVVPSVVALGAPGVMVFLMTQQRLQHRMHLVSLVGEQSQRTAA